jgi:hypothetical protein
VQKGVVRGEIQDGRVHLSNAGDWHSRHGWDRPPRGYLESYGGVLNEPMQTQRSGSFILNRISDEGYYGPAA